MAGKAWGNEYRTTVVCIHSYENKNPCGYFHNPYLSEGRSFNSMTQFLTEMEQALNSMEFPQSFAATRTFAAPPEHGTGPPGTEETAGALATFALRILFRQNASWQGSVTWLEGRKEQSFRSVLELILLMDSALSSKEPVEQAS